MTVLTPDQLKAIASLMVGTDMRIEDAKEDLGLSGRLAPASISDLHNRIAWCPACSKWNYVENFKGGSCCV